MQYLATRHLSALHVWFFFWKTTNGTAVCCAPRLQQQPLFTDPWCFLSFMPGACSPPCSPCSCNARLSCLQRIPLRCGFVMHEYPFVVPSFRGSLCACRHLLPSALLSSLQRLLPWLRCSEHHPVTTYAVTYTSPIACLASLPATLLPCGTAAIPYPNVCLPLPLSALLAVRCTRIPNPNLSAPPCQSSSSRMQAAQCPPCRMCRWPGMPRCNNASTVPFSYPNSTVEQRRPATVGLSQQQRAPAPALCPHF